MRGDPEDLPPQEAGEVARIADDQQDVGSACERQGWQASRKGVFLLNNYQQQ